MHRACEQVKQGLDISYKCLRIAYKPDIILDIVHPLWNVFRIISYGLSDGLLVHLHTLVVILCYKK